MKPIILNSTLTLSMVRRFDNISTYTFTLDASYLNETPTVWINQKRFNDLTFVFGSVFESPELPDRPLYVHDMKIGITGGKINAVVSSIPRDGGTERYIGFNKTYDCNNGASADNPQVTITTCSVNETNFKTLIEHGDIMTVTFHADNGGFRKMTGSSTNLINHNFIGLSEQKQVQFLFDFDAPKHCSERNTSYDFPQFNSCPINPEQPLRVVDEITKDPIEAVWGDWTDELSGIWEFRILLFKLVPDGNRLKLEEEDEGLNPVIDIIMTNPSELSQVFDNSLYSAGMYSVVMETRDMANNSKVARRLVLYDPESNVTLNNDDSARLYISSAVEETGYSWQTASGGGSGIQIDVKWDNHFGNRFHEENLLLNAVHNFPTQFEDIELDGILMSKRFVYPGMDDTEGERTTLAIPNIHGIVKFEINKIYTSDDQLPETGWEEISPLQQTHSFEESLEDGGSVRIWVRATDVLGNTAVDNTMVIYDGTPPAMSDPEVSKNFANGTYTYTTRVEFSASDDKSGVHKVGYRIFLIPNGDTLDIPSEPDTTGEFPANMKEINESNPDPLCRNIHDKCFLVEQSMDLDNCLFMVDKEVLDTASAVVEVVSFNQALLTTTKRFTINSINSLSGLEKYSGPTNLRVDAAYENAVRLIWDLPESPSCYGRAEIVLILFTPGSNETTPIVLAPETKFFDIAGLLPGSAYSVELGLQFAGRVGTAVEINFETASKQVDSGFVSVGAIVGGVIGAVVLIGLMLAVFFVMLRRGHMQPVRRRLDAISVRYRNRKSIFGKNDAGTSGATGAGGVSNKAYEKHRPVTSFADELYIYGGMNFETVQSWHLSRNDVTFESVLKSGHFANIYKGKLQHNGKRDIVAVKTLKEGYSQEDEMLMKAKINFSGTIVGSHPNVIAFLGAVIDDSGVGPFIVYEFCENGTLKDYLTSNKANVTLELQENLYRFGLDVAKAMDYLAGKGIVHRRLAARNILLTFLNEIKVAGFGPQPVEQKDGDGDVESGKKERIPVKWMPPECMESTAEANEKSDVWSYGVVLWEIFTLGEQPYGKIRSRELPAALKKGERLPKPEQCDDTWYGVMQRTWNLKPAKRPTFEQIRTELDGLFVQSSGDENYYYSSRN